MGMLHANMTTDGMKDDRENSIQMLILNLKSLYSGRGTHSLPPAFNSQAPKLYRFPATHPKVINPITMKAAFLCFSG